MIKVGVLGSTGYAGQQLVWLLANHSNIQINLLNSHNYTGIPFEKIYGNFQGFIHKNCINMQDSEQQLAELDLLFMALPNGTTFDITKKALSQGVKVIDLGADFRLRSQEVYTEWYKVNHGCSELLESAVYGLSELYREKIKKAQLVANPGCYPTASILALYPLLNNNIIKKDSIIIDAKSGVSGAGRSTNTSSLYCECNESIKAYGVTTHRHTPEIEQELSKAAGTDIKLSFTPHLVPMNRGILSVCYGNLSESADEEQLLNLYKEFYKDDYFIKITDELPETKWVKGSNNCHISLRVDKRTGRVIVISAIDNLIKGAAGQAVQNMNIMFGLDEKTGLNFPAMMP